MRYAGWMKLEREDPMVVVCIEEGGHTYSMLCECSPRDVFPVAIFHGFAGETPDSDTSEVCPLCESRYTDGEECEVSRDRLQLWMEFIMDEVDIMYVRRSVRRFILFPE